MARDKSMVFPLEKLETGITRPRRNYLLIIGINTYEDSGIQNLHNAVPDAKRMAEVLTNRYVFDKQYLVSLYDDDATRENIIQELDRLTDQIGPEDNLLIYFSGHGYFRSKSKIGYLVPSNAKIGEYYSLLPNSTFRDYLRGIQAHHLLLVVDSCFSGSLILERDIISFDKVSEGISNYARRVDRFRSRLGVAAGRIETVSDGLVGSHSPFARSMIQYLEANTYPELPAQWLFQHVNTITTYNADQTPISGVLDKTLHDGGEFIFQLQPDEPQDWKKARTENSVKGYEQYIQMYPKGSHIEEAFWSIAQLTNTKNAYRDYMDNFPQGAYYREAVNGLALCEEKQRFEQAKRKGEAALRTFLLDYPEGHFAPNAEAEVERVLREERELQARKEAQEGGKEELQKYLTQFPETQYAPEAKVKLEQIHEQKKQEQALLKQEESEEGSIKKRKPRRIWVSVGVFAALSITAVLLWPTFQSNPTFARLNTNTKTQIEAYLTSVQEFAGEIFDTETKSWEKAIETHTIAAFENYLLLHDSDGNYIKEAKDSLDVIQNRIEMFVKDAKHMKDDYPELAKQLLDKALILDPDNKELQSLLQKLK